MAFDPKNPIDRPGEMPYARDVIGPLLWVNYRVVGVAYELSVLTSADERGLVWLIAAQRVDRRRSAFIFALNCALIGVAFAIFALARRWVLSRLDVQPVLMSAISIATLAVLLLCSVYGSLWLRRRAYRDAVRQVLRERGIPVCMHCGYCLRGQTEPRCPECGIASSSGAAAG